MISVQFENESLEKAFLKFKADWELNNSFEVFSSGSTGKPKKILLSKEKMFLSAKKTISFFKLEEGTSAMLCLSIETIAGKMMLARSFVGKWNLWIVEPRSNPILNSDKKIDFVALVPMQLERILLETPEKIKLFKIIIVGGAPVSDFLQNLLKKYKVTVFQTFGMTETLSHIALRKIGYEKEQHYNTIDGVEVSVKSQNLVIHYPEMFENPIQTNDLVKIHSPRQFEWLGRSDFMINSGGIKINPEKIEQKLAEYIPFPFFVTGLDDKTLGQKLALVIESLFDFIPEKQFLIKGVEKYEVPKVFVNIDKFERTNSGKINRLKTLEKLNTNDWQEIV